MPIMYIVPQAYRYVIERLGKYHKTAGEGLQFKFPFIDRIVKKVVIMEQVLDSPPQPVITKDNVTVQIDSVLYFNISDARLYTYGAVDPLIALGNLAATTLRNVVGEMTLDDALTSRDIINGKLTSILDTATDKWGIKVSRVELKNITVPPALRDAMEKQMRAERDKREKILEAEAHREASITRAEGDKQAAILAAEGDAEAKKIRAEGDAQAILMQKRAEAEGLAALKGANIDDKVLALMKYESLVAMADGQASKIIVPTDAVDMTTRSALFSEVSGLGSVTKPGHKSIKLPKNDPCCD